MFGLDVDVIRDIRAVFSQFPHIQKVLIYGSRAKGNYRAGSDIDLSLIGKGMSLGNTIYPLMGKLDDLNLPYTFDVSIFKKLDNLDFIDHILRVGKIFYQKEDNIKEGWREKKSGNIIKLEYAKPLEKGARIPDGKFLEYGANGMKTRTNPFPHNKPSIKAPNLSNQKRIVPILDQELEAIDTAIENAEKNIKNCQEIFNSYLASIFANPNKEWGEKTLNEISENLDSKRVPITKRLRKEGDIPYYGASGIVDYIRGYLFDEDLLLISEDRVNLLARTYPLAFSIKGKAWVNNHVHVLRFKNIINQQFIEYYFNSIKLDNFVSGMTQAKLNQKILNSIPLPWPPLTFQKKTVKEIKLLSEKLKKLSHIYEQKMANFQRLKKSILQQAFKGELTG